MKEDLRRVEVIVSLWVDEDTDVAELVNEMDYQFTVNGKVSFSDLCIWFYRAK